MRALVACLGICFGSCYLAEAGVLVVHSDKTYSFLEAYELTANGKDKLLSLGSTPVAVSDKLPAVAIAAPLVRDADSGVFAQVSDGSVDYEVPRGKGKNEGERASDLWKNASISYRTAPKDKATNDVSADKFVAYLPGGPDDLVGICKNEKVLSLVGGKAKVFQTQVALITAVAANYKTGANSTALAKYVEDAMRQRFERFTSGTASLETFTQALQFSELSSSAFPNDPGQTKLRQALADLKRRLDRRVAVLTAFSSTEQWDPFLLENRDFASYQEAYPAIASQHSLALQASLKAHESAGDELLQKGEYGAAYREFRTALLRNPADEKLQQKRLMAWSDYSRQVAIDHKGSRKQLTAGQIDAANQDLLFATRYRDEGKLDAALKKVEEAEAINPDGLDVLLVKATVLGAQGDFTAAFSALDSYDLLAIGEERNKGSQLRNELLFKRTSRVDEAKSQAQAAWKQMNFLQARETALGGLRAKDDDPDLLFYAGASSLAARQQSEAKTYLGKYLDSSDTLSANAQQAATVRRLLAFNSPIGTLPQTGPQNWMSGSRVAPGIFYDPVSLSFGPHVERIEASGKMKVFYQWQNGRLVSINPSWDKPDQATGERKVSFVYDQAAHQAVRVADSDVRQVSVDWKDDEFLANSAIVGLNNPYVDPVAIQQITGKNIALTVTGNPYFNPFVWTKICYFQLSYDETGRVTKARQLADPHGPPTDNLVEFEWQGLRLAAIRAYHVSGSDKALVYTRTMEYDGGQLVAEDIDGQGKAAHIRYKYEGNHLVAASCDKDATVDGRSRQVSFSGAD